MQKKEMGDLVIFSTDFKLPETFEIQRKAKTKLGSEFDKRLKRAWEEDSEGAEYNRLYKKLVEENIRTEQEHYSKQAQFSGRGFFYKKLAKLYLRKDILENIVAYLTQDNFFQFSLAVNSSEVGITWEDKYLIPPIARFPRGEVPVVFNETIFQQGLDYLWYGKVVGNSLFGICLTLTLMYEEPSKFSSQGTFSAQDYVDYMKKMSPHAVKKLFSKTNAEVRKAIEVIIKREYRSREPCVISVKKGFLLANKANRDSETIERLAKKGCPIFSKFASVGVEDFVPEEIDFFMQKVINLTDLRGGQGFSREESYFYLKNGKLVAHQRKSNKEFVVD